MEPIPHADYAKLNELLKSLNIAMLTTVDSEGHMRSRPMGTQNALIEEGLWFFTDKDSSKVREIQKNPSVNVSYSEMGKSIWLSVHGKALIVEAQAELEKRWSPELKAWFPEGVETPGLCLIKVEGEGAEYWDNPNGKIVMAFGLIKSAFTGKREDLGENERVTL